MPRKKSGLFDQNKYVQQYIRDKVTVKKVGFNRETDADLLEWLSDKKFSTFVKDLLRAYKDDHLVVRCKYCKHHGHDTCSAGAGVAYPPPDDWFCADGEKKE